MQRWVELQEFAHDGDQHVDADYNPLLRLDRVLGGADESLDPQRLLDPLEDELKLPTAAIELGGGGQREVGGQEKPAYWLRRS